MAQTPERALELAIVRLAKVAETPSEIQALASLYEKLRAPGGVVDHTIHVTDSSTMLDQSHFWDDHDDRRTGFKAHGSHAPTTFVRREHA